MILESKSFISFIFMSSLMQTRSFLGAMMGLVVYMNVEFDTETSLLVSLSASPQSALLPFATLHAAERILLLVTL